MSFEGWELGGGPPVSEPIDRLIQIIGLRHLLQHWLAQGPGQKLLFEPTANPGRELSVQIYTATYLYRIHAHTFGGTYLGCTAQARASRPGQLWPEYRDLPDGRLTEDTWNRIICAIVANELVPIEGHTPYPWPSWRPAAYEAPASGASGHAGEVA